MLRRIAPSKKSSIESTDLEGKLLRAREVAVLCYSAVNCIRHCYSFTTGLANTDLTVARIRVMSFDVTLVDVDALGLSKRESSLEEIVSALYDSDQIGQEEARRANDSLQRIVEKLENIYGTLKNPSSNCPWVMWPPGIGVNGNSVTLCMGWSAGESALKEIEKLCNDTSISVIHAQPLEKTSNSAKEEDVRLLGIIEDEEIPVYIKFGSFGPYFIYGEYDDGKKPETQQIRDAMGIDPGSASLEDALRVRAFKRVLGKDSNGDNIVVKFGSQSPYIRYKNKYYMSSDIDAFNIDLQEAIALAESGEIEPNWRAG